MAQRRRQQEQQLLIAILAAEQSRRPHRPSPATWKLSTWSDASFKRRLRMTKRQFAALKVHFQASASFIAAGCHRSRRFSSEVWLAATLRDLADSTALDMAMEPFGIPESHYSAKRELLMNAVVEACRAAGQGIMGFPTTRAGWEHLATTFKHRSYPEFSTDAAKVVLAADGSLIPFSPYGAMDPKVRERWRCRKGFLATNCVMYFDGRRRYVLDDRCGFCMEIISYVVDRIVHADILFEGAASDQVC